MCRVVGCLCDQAGQGGTLCGVAKRASRKALHPECGRPGAVPPHAAYCRCCPRGEGRGCAEAAAAAGREPRAGHKGCAAGAAGLAGPQLLVLCRRREAEAGPVQRQEAGAQGPERRIPAALLGDPGVEGMISAGRMPGTPCVCGCGVSAVRRKGRMGASAEEVGRARSRKKGGRECGQKEGQQEKERERQRGGAASAASNRPGRRTRLLTSPLITLRVQGGCRAPLEPRPAGWLLHHASLAEPAPAATGGCMPCGISAWLGHGARVWAASRGVGG